jgi:hypothetical protein
MHDRLTNLLLVRIRAPKGRTFWLVADAETTRTYTPHVSRREAVARFELETRREHGRLAIQHGHYSFSEARELVRRAFGPSPAGAIAAVSN